MQICGDKQVLSDSCRREMRRNRQAVQVWQDRETISAGTGQKHNHKPNKRKLWAVQIYGNSLQTEYGRREVKKMTIADRLEANGIRRSESVRHGNLVDGDEENEVD